MPVTSSEPENHQNSSQMTVYSLPPKQKKLLLIVGKVVCIFLILLGFSSFFVISSDVFGLLGLRAATPHSATADGTITKIIEDQHTNTDGSSSLTCTFGYTFNVAGQSYKGIRSMGSSAYCGFSEGAVVKINYNPDDPVDNSYASSNDDAEAFVSRFNTMFAVSGIAMSVIGIGGLLLLGRVKKISDLDGDGMDNDQKPASEAQMKLIENGFRELGQFYVRPSRTIKQGEARETLTRINEQLHNKQSSTNKAVE